MTRSSSLVLGLGCLFLTGSAAALPPPLPSTPQAPLRQRTGGVKAEPNLKFTQTAIDFGEITDERKIEVEFPFQNVGSESIKIKNVEPSCGCTTAELDKTVFLPGEWGVIRATFNPENRQGEQHKSISVYTTDKNAGVQRLMLGGTIRPIAYAEPGIINLARVNKGETATKTIEVYGQLADFKITEIVVTNPELFEAEQLEGTSVEIEGRTLRRIPVRVTLKGARKAGQESAFVQLHTNDERRPVLAVQVAVVVNSELALDSPMISVGRIAVGDPFKHELVLRHTEERPFKIVSVTHEGKSFGVTLEWEPIEESSAAYRIRVRGEALLASRGYRDRVVITTDLEDESPIEAYFTGTTSEAAPQGAEGAPAPAGRAPVVGGAP